MADSGTAEPRNYYHSSFITINHNKVTTTPKYYKLLPFTIRFFLLFSVYVTSKHHSAMSNEGNLAICAVYYSIIYSVSLAVISLQVNLLCKVCFW